MNQRLSRKSGNHVSTYLGNGTCMS